MKRPLKSKVIYSKKLPNAARFSEETMLFYDSILVKNKSFKSWLKAFPFKIALKSGEELKTLKSFEAVLNKVSNLPVPKTAQLTFAAIGGGSVGDFVGFFSSVYLRGRNLVLIPSTWLAAVDSSHGGKNGLNFLKTKNQIGTFYPAAQIYICEELLLSQPDIRLIESMGEIIKIAVLSDAKLFDVIEKKISASELYKLLPKIIGHKYKIIDQDPYEKKGLRRLLNLGHTMGHVFESHYALPHGISVLLGLQFAARWSFKKGMLIQEDFFRISMLIDLLELSQNLNFALNNMTPKNITALLCKDKKLTAKNQLDFIFIKKIGSCIRQPATIEQILVEIKRQIAEY